MANEFEVKGLAELHKELEKLPTKIEKNATRGALRAGAKVFRDRAKELAPVKTGTLRDSIKIKTSARKGKAIKATVQAGSSDAYYAHMVEQGTIAHLIKPRSRKSLFIAGLFMEVVEHPGAGAHPFMRPAFDEKHKEAVQAMAAYLRKRIPKEIAKQQ